MRYFLTLFSLFVLFQTSLQAQAPQAISYQAVARNAAGNPVSNSNVRLQIAIRNLSVGGAVLYREQHLVTTSPLGLFSLGIGSGTIVSGSFTNIDWSNGNKFLQVEIDTTGGFSFVNMGAQQLLSVPYALNALNTWNTFGNSGLNDSLNFIGTTSSGVLNFRVSNQKAGKIDFPAGNTFFGFQSGNANTTGLNNTAVGNKALRLTTTGRHNTAIGDEALYNNVASWGNTAVGYHSQWGAGNSTSTTFNYNTSIGYNSLQGSGDPAVNTGGGNTALGPYTLYVNSSGGNNTATGFQSMTFNQTGSNNTAIGLNSLYNNISGFGNVAAGVNSLRNNKAGHNGVAIGGKSQFNSNTTLSYWENRNTSVGYQSMEGSAADPDNNTFNENTAVGYASLQLLSTGINNAALGYLCLQNTSSGINNTSVGFAGMQVNTTGNSNTSIGSMSLGLNNTGDNNTAIGFNTLVFNTSGSLNTALGYNAGVPAGVTNLSNATAIGANAVVNTSNALVLGNNANVGIGLSNPTHKLQLGTDDACKPTTNTWTIVSDVRLKNVEGNYTKGLNEILQLRPILYHYKNTGSITFTEDVLKTQAVGFSAQDVQKIFPECVTTDADGYLNFNMHAILVAQVNAIKEQQEEIDLLKSENETLRKEVALIKTKLGL